MNVLFIYDSSLVIGRHSLSSIGVNDSVLLFPLTSVQHVTTLLAESLRKGGCTVRILESADLINASADSLREKYIQFVSELSRKETYAGKDLKSFFAFDDDTTLWWFSLVAEKNTFKSDAFNKLAQLDAVIESINRENVEMVALGCSDRKLQAALLEYIANSSIKLVTLHTKCTKCKKNLLSYMSSFQSILYVKHIVMLFAYSIYFFQRTWKIKRKAGRLSALPASGNSIAIITYFPNFDIESAKQGIFKNKYYSHLQESLMRRGHKIIWVAMCVKSNSMTFHETLDHAKRFKEKGNALFLIEEFCTIPFMIRALLLMLISSVKFLLIARRVRAFHDLKGYNFYGLFMDDWFSSFCGKIGYQGIVHYFLFRSMLDKLKATTCLYYCEMHAWEKALAFARKAVGCKATLIAYQHATVSPMLLNYFNNPDEINDAGSYMLPKPDIIACNGKRPLTYFMTSGWQEKSLSLVEAIRYTHLKHLMHCAIHKTRKIVLIALSISPLESSSIFNVSFNALNGLDGIEIWIKPHPFLKMEDVTASSGIKLEDSTFILRNDPIETLLTEAQIVIAGESSVSLEALALGCEIVIVKVPELINMSPLRDIESPLVKTIDNPSDLHAAVLGLLSKESDGGENAAESRRIIDEFFFLGEKESNEPEKFLKLIEAEDILLKRC